MLPFISYCKNHASEHQKLFGLLTIEKGIKSRSGGSDAAARNSKVGKIAAGNKRMKDSEHLVRKFVAGLSGCKDFPVPVPATNLDDGIISLYLLFESQSESLTPSKLGDKTMVGCVCTASLSLYNAYMYLVTAYLRVAASGSST